MKKRLTAMVLCACVLLGGCGAPTAKVEAPTPTATESATPRPVPTGYSYTPKGIEGSHIDYFWEMLKLYGGKKRDPDPPSELAGNGYFYTDKIKRKKYELTYMIETDTEHKIAWASFEIIFRYDKAYDYKEDIDEVLYSMIRFPYEGADPDAVTRWMIDVVHDSDYKEQTQKVETRISGTRFKIEYSDVHVELFIG